MPNTPTLEGLKKLLRMYNVCLLAIMEPMMGSQQLDFFKEQFRFSHVISNAESKLWLMCSEELVSM